MGFCSSRMGLASLFRLSSCWSPAFFARLTQHRNNAKQTFKEPLSKVQFLVFQIESEPVLRSGLAVAAQWF